MNNYDETMNDDAYRDDHEGDTVLNEPTSITRTYDKFSDPNDHDPFGSDALSDFFKNL